MQQLQRKGSSADPNLLKLLRHTEWENNTSVMIQLCKRHIQIASLMINLEDEWWNQAIELFSWWAWRGTLHPSGDKTGLFKMLKKKIDVRYIVIAIM